MKRAFLYVLVTLLFSCREEVKQGIQQPLKQGSKNKEVVVQEFANELRTLPKKPGYVGIYRIPEMLSLSIMDSGYVSQIPAKVQLRYNQLEEDIKGTGAQKNGPFGQISYNNDTTNFKFECFVLIRQIPEGQPAYSKVVILEAERMAVYNYYGPYQLLYAAYGELAEYLRKENLTQAGPMREYYFSNPLLEPDWTKLRTILMVPVRDGEK